MSDFKITSICTTDKYKRNNESSIFDESSCITRQTI